MVFIRGTHLTTATGTFIHRALNFFPGLPGAFLDAPDQFIFLAFDELQVVIRESCEFLFQLALGNVPVSFGCESAHMIFEFVRLFQPRDPTRREFLFASGVPTG